MITHRRVLTKGFVKDSSDQQCLWQNNAPGVDKHKESARAAADRQGHIAALCSSVSLSAFSLWLLLLLSNTAVSADRLNDLGRLFTDASQRQMLEAARHGEYVDDADRANSVSSVTVDGVMMRSDGSTVVWVNGSSSLEGSSVKGVRVYPDSVDERTYKVPLNVDGKAVKIKPGQTWSDSSGHVKDNY